MFAIVSPCGKKFRSKPQIARFLGENADLTCFDFSRAGTMADGTQRRRARDRNPQGLSRKVEQRPTIAPPTIRPLTMNPLRPSGPVRRTCGVIKLPVMLLSPPVGDTTLRDNILGQQGVNDQKTHSLNVVVQSFWEKRLKTVNPLDHLSGKEISRRELQQQQQQARQDKSPNETASITTPLQQTAPPPIPSLLSSQQLTGGVSPLHSSQASPPHSALNSHRIVPPITSTITNSPLTGTKLLQVHQLKSISNSTTSLSNAAHIPQCVTDNDVILQEQRVQLLRQQLMAAQSGL